MRWWSWSSNQGCLVLGLDLLFITFCWLSNRCSNKCGKSTWIWWDFRMSSEAQLSQQIASSCADHPSRLWLPGVTSNLAVSIPAVSGHTDYFESIFCIVHTHTFLFLQQSSFLDYQIKATNNSFLLLFPYSVPGHPYWHANFFLII